MGPQEHERLAVIETKIDTLVNSVDKLTKDYVTTKTQVNKWKGGITALGGLGVLGTIGKVATDWLYK